MEHLFLKLLKVLAALMHIKYSETYIDESLLQVGVLLLQRVSLVGGVFELLPQVVEALLELIKLEGKLL